VYVVVQKHHHCRLFDASRVRDPAQAPERGPLDNLRPGAVVDSTIVSPVLCV
jgi:hypothetical protein